MMQFSKWKIGAVALVCMLLPGSVHAQIVKNERLLSFEEKQVPAFVTTAAGSQLGISDEHYRDGDHSLSWTFEPGAALSIKKDLKFEKKDPTGKDTYLSAFIVWVYNEHAPLFLLASTLPVGAEHGYVMNAICKVPRKKGWTKSEL